MIRAFLCCVVLTWYLPLLGNTDLIKVVVTINGKGEAISPGGVIKAFLGDRLIIKEAEIESGQRPEIINLVGFRSSGSNNPFDDTGKLVLVGRDLNVDWSQDGKGLMYRINVRTGSIMHGRVFLQVSEPKVDYISIKINGQLKKVSPNQELELRSSDVFSLENVSANFDVRSPHFHYRVVEAKGGRKELVLSRYTKKVATFPIKAY